jgi:putative ABC transport system permease protein
MSAPFEQLQIWLQHRVAVLRLDVALAARNIVRQRRRSAFGLGAIAAGVISLMLASGFFEWNQDALREGITRAQLGHLQFVKRGYLEAGAADPFSFVFPETLDDRGLLEAVPQAVAIAPRLAFTGLISIGDSTVSFIGEGVAPEKERLFGNGLDFQAGENLSRADGDEAILGRGLARTLGVKPGDRVVLVAAPAGGGINAVEVTVTGIFSTVTKAYDDYALRVPLAVAQRLVRTDGVHALLVLLEKADQTPSVLNKLRRKLQAPEMTLVPWYEAPGADFYNKTVRLFARQVWVVKLMIGVIIVLSISNTMMANVRERIAEIGTCMALGDNRRVVRRRFMTEGAVLGMFGGLLGVAVGTALAKAISQIGIPMPPPPGAAIGYTAGIRVTFGIVADALSLSVATAFVAGVLPAWRASRLNIVDALRHAR